MPPHDVDRATPLVALHGLGSSARAFEPVAARLRLPLALHALDLPGFGAARAEPWTTTAAVVRHVLSLLRARIAPLDEPWLLVGHSLGGRIATLVATALRDDALAPAGVVLLAPSPPSREPMDAERRQQMLAWAATGAIDADAARTFVDANVGAPLPADLDRLAVDDAARSDAAAWTAWLDAGSREDWSVEVGELDLPALILSGSADDDLGTVSQHRLHQSVYPNARWQQLDGAGHLLALERPQEVAAAIDAFWSDLRVDRPRADRP